jgi:hypothetical protein
LVNKAAVSKIYAPLRSRQIGQKIVLFVSFGAELLVYSVVRYSLEGQKEPSNQIVDSIVFYKQPQLVIGSHDYLLEPTFRFQAPIFYNQS